MKNISRRREKIEGWNGRKRNYTCRECGVKFQVDTLAPLSVIDRVCPNCKSRTYIYTFTDKQTGEDKQIRASNAELAILRAWKINPNLTFKLPDKGDI